MSVRLVLKPHPNCKKYGEMIDIMSMDSDLPWASVHIDTFRQIGVNPENELHNLLWKDKRTVAVTLNIEDVS